MAQEPEVEKQHSLLTPLFREYLNTDPQKGDNQTDIRFQMRDRVITGLTDIARLNQYARSDDIKQIFQRKRTDQRTDGNFATSDDRDMMRGTNWVFARHMIEFVWRGLRLNGGDKDEIFGNVILRGIEDGEADYKGVPHGYVESDIKFKKLKAAQTDEFTALEKIERELALSGEEWQEVMKQLNEEIDRDFRGENLVALAKEHLIENGE